MIEKTLNRLKIDYEIINNEAWALCPLHERRTGSEDHNPSWSINLDTGLHNCLGGDTGVVTWDGVVPIRKLSGGTHRLLTSAGWQDAPVKSFGVQQLWEVNLSRNGVKKTIYATKEHRWFAVLNNGPGRIKGSKASSPLPKPFGSDRRREFTTDQLKVGYALSTVHIPNGRTNKHRERWGAAKQVKERQQWVVESVVPTDRFEEVYCAVVEGTHDFVLEDHILTGNCFSCHYRGNLTRLVMDILVLSDPDQAKDWLADDFDPEYLATVLKKVAPRPKISVIPASEALYFSFPDPPDHALHHRSVSRESALRYRVKYTRTQGWLFPFYGMEGEFYGHQSKLGHKVRNHPYGIKKSAFLFGQFGAPHLGLTVVTESPLDAMLAWDAGFSAVALYGSSPSEEQIMNLFMYENLVIALDNDEAGERGTETLVNRMGGITPLRLVDWPEYVKDFGDDPEGVQELINNAVTPLELEMRKLAENA